uniref:Coat protein n=1 Tax=Actinidia yellowing virus 2 TaxID=2715796 RepID=A0A8B6MVE4_9VIRU|nr:coat protein [Actinidia yellowing virus 2]
MYSLTAVGGIQYTTDNMTKTTQQKRTKVVNNHRFNGCRDAFMQGGTGATPGVTALGIVTTSASGNTSGSYALCPIGLTGVKTVTAGTVTIGGTGNISSPPLRGLFNKAVDFQWYRVTRAKLVFVGNVGSTTTGSLILCGYTSPMDVSVGTSIATTSSRSTKTFDLASSAGKELSVPVPVDSSWKKVSSILSTSGNAAPFFGGSDTFVNVATVEDLCFGSVSYSVIGAPAAAALIGSLYLDYDVEFKGVIDSNVNI